jgi:cell division protein FtsB
MIAKNQKIKSDNRTQDVFFSLFIAILFFGAAIFLIISNHRISAKRAEMIGKIETLKKEIQVLEEQNNNLQIGISQATSTAYQEEKMREQGYQRPGEQNVVVVPPEKKPEAPAEEKKSWWEIFLAKINF